MKGANMLTGQSGYIPEHCKSLVNEQCEIDLIWAMITHPAGFDIGCAGIVSIRRYEEPMWVVEWEEYNNPHDSDCKSLVETLEFSDSKRAAECFVELRRKCKIGLDLDSPNRSGYYMLVKDIIAQNCTYCGDPPKFSKFKAGHKYKLLKYNGIDRINNELGYLIGNCVPCCSTCNGAKSDLTINEFQSWIKRLVNFINGN